MSAVAHPERAGRPRAVGAALALLLFGSLLPIPRAYADRAALAQSPASWTGRTVDEVVFVAPPVEDLDELAALVEQRAGASYDPQAVARSLALLYRLDRFEEVEAWLEERAGGGLRLRFELLASPRIGEIVLDGVGPGEGPGVRAALSRARGDRYATGDEDRLALDAARWYRAEGWLDAEAQAVVATPRGGARRIRITVAPGQRYRISEVRFPGGELQVLSDRQLQRFLPPELRPGRPWRERDLQGAVERVLNRYRSAGFVEARLLAAPDAAGTGRSPVSVERTGPGTLRVRLPIDPGPLAEVRLAWRRPLGAATALDLEHKEPGQGVRAPPGGEEQAEATAETPTRPGRPPPGLGRPALLETIGWSTAGSVSSAFAEDASEALVRQLQARGFLFARVEAELEAAVSPTPRPGTPEWQRPFPKEARRLSFTLKPGPPVRLRAADVRMQGQRFASARELRQVLWDASPSVLGHRDRLWALLGIDLYRHFFTEAEMDGAARVMEDWYRARGFQEARVSWSHRVTEARRGSLARRVNLDIAIVEGARTRVRTMRIEGLPPGTDRDVPTWRREVEGAPYNPASIADWSARVREHLADHGFADAEVVVEAVPGPAAGLVDLELAVKPMAAVRFGAVIVRDNRHTHANLVRRELAAGGVSSGAPFRNRALRDAQERVLRTGLFDGVTLQPAQEGGTLRDIEAVVRERNRFAFVLGGGLSWPDDGPRVSGELRLRNLDGRGLSLWARGRFGIRWAYLFDPDLIPQPDYRASIGLDLPQVPGLGVQGSLTAVVHEQIDEATYRIDRSSIALSLAIRRLAALELDARVELQQRAPVRVDPAARLHPSADLPVARVWKDADTFVLFGLNLAADLRDDRFNPTRGLFLSLSAESTPGAIAEGAPAFGRAQGRAVGWIPFGTSAAGLQLEGAAGFAWSYDGELPPIEYRFRLGGTSTVRGFALDDVGASGNRPGVLADEGLLTSGFPERRVPVGGNAYYRYSAQVQLPIPSLRAFRLVFFHDAGNTVVVGSVPDGVDPSFEPGLSWSVGLGIRRTTPIGPLRIDIGLRPDRFAPLARGEAILGDAVRVHFAVGAL